jgi:hypothetical protein
MPITSASSINWNPPPRCPICRVGITASGRSQPFAVEGDRVYCREHGVTIEPSYPEKLREYEAWRQRRATAIDALEEDVAPKKKAAG